MKARAVVVFALAIFLLGLTGCARVNKAVKKVFYDPGKATPAEFRLNRLPLPDPQAASYRFLVIGHGYGSTTVDDHLPDPALLEKIPEINDLGLSMLVSLGDLVQQSIPEDFDHLQRSLLDPLNVPVFNTPGNHDVVNRDAYQARFGQTYYSFRAGPAQMIFLDTEREPCSIDSEQQKMLSTVLARALRDRQVEQIFIFMHKTLFFANPRLAEINQLPGIPNVMDCYASAPFAALLDETILPAARQKPVILFGGDVGAWANLTPYYEKRSDAALTMVMTGLGDNPQNAGILVTVEGGAVRMEVYSLTGQPVQPLEDYTPEYWIERVAP
jgi:hypothetical protein